MEWIIGILILWGISSLFERGGASEKQGYRRSRDIPSTATVRKPLRDAQASSAVTAASKTAVQAHPRKSVTPASSETPRGFQFSPQRTSVAPNGAAVAKRNVSNDRVESGDQDDIEAWAEWVKLSEGAANPWESDDFRNALDFLQSKGISSLWHMTHKDNLPDILLAGILGHEEARKSRKVTDISEASVQALRTKVEPIYGRRLHEYAPLYFNVRNPMLFLRQNLNSELCLLEVSLDVLRDTARNGLVYSDGNAASGVTRFFSDLKDVQELPWNVLASEYWNDKEDGKRKRCAEVLIHPKVPVRNIIRVHCWSRELTRALSGLHGNVVYNPALFFGA